MSVTMFLYLDLSESDLLVFILASLQSLVFLKCKLCTVIYDVSIEVKMPFNALLNGFVSSDRSGLSSE